ncbi:hypothetical protein KM043_014435 [Ampulex compressa]|nr:hypothetical protein KM043_014435 [Ampulex compressa]
MPKSHSIQQSSDREEKSGMIPYIQRRKALYRTTLWTSLPGPKVIGHRLRTATSWESRKQRTVALSSIEAGHMAISDATKEAAYLTNFLKKLEHSNLADVTIYNDNHSAGHHSMQNVQQDYPVHLTYLPTEEMIADTLTKAFLGTRHMRRVVDF